MDPITAIVAGLSLVIVSVVSIVLFMNSNTAQKEIDTKMKNVVNQINDSQYIAYKFDQNQQQSLRSINSNISSLDASIKSTQKNVNDIRESTSSDIASIRNDYVHKDTLPKGVPAVRTNRLQLGNNHVFSACNNNMLVMYNTSNEIRGGLTTQDMIVMRNAAVSNIVTNDAAVYNELAVKSVDGSPYTVFRSKGTNEIKGDTSIGGGLNVTGPISSDNSVLIKGKLRFLDAKDNQVKSQSDYSLERISSVNNNSLRLNLSGTTNDSVDIWSGKGKVHAFSADGTATHSGTFTAKTVQASSFNTPESKATIDATGSAFFQNSLGIGAKPGQNGRVMIEGGTPQTYNTIINNTLSRVSFAKGDGNALRVDANSAKEDVSALSVYSATGELLNINASGRVAIGVGTRDTVLRGPLKVAKSIDALETSAGARAPLNLGAGSSKVIIGNNNSGGFGFADTSAPKDNVTVVTNPLYVNKTLKVDRSQNEPVPSTWSSGIHASQIYANGTIGTGLNGLQAAYMTNTGDIYGKVNQPSDYRLKDDIKPLAWDETSKLSKLKPVSYKYKSDPQQQTRFGFIAQEVEKVYPHLVHDSLQGTKALDYTGIIPIMVDRVQTLDKALPADKQALCLGNTCITEKDLRKIKGL